MDESVHTTCSVCFLSYNNKERKPLVLPCSHSYCQTCLLQMDTFRNKTCPHCRASWQNVQIKDLVFCYQLIPSHVPEAASSAQLCVHHRENVSIWCNTCRGSLCIKCLKSNHQSCQWVLIQDERIELINKYSETMSHLKKCSIEKYTNQNKLMFQTINRLQKELPQLEQDLTKYELEVNSWQKEVQREHVRRINKDESIQNVTNIQQLQERVDKLQSPPKPESLLFSVVEAIATSHDGTSASFASRFLENQTARTESNANTSNEESDLEEEEEEYDNTQCNIPLIEGQEWVVHNGREMAAAKFNLSSTSVRPSTVSITGTRWKTKEVIEFMEVIASVKCEIKICFHDSFWNVSKGSYVKTWRRVAPLFRENHRCSLVELSAHLDVVALKEMPPSMRKIGLVLSAAGDMEAVNVLSTIGFYDEGGINIKWKNLACIELSVLRTFQPDDWKLTWEWRYPNGISWRSGSLLRGGTVWRSGMAYLQYMKIDIALYFPNLQESHIKWTIDIIHNITEKLKFVRLVKKLYLPNPEITTDALLGVLRDCGLCCEVHLPPRMARNIKEEEKRFWKYSFWIVWDHDL